MRLRQRRVTLRTSRAARRSARKAVSTTTPSADGWKYAWPAYSGSGWPKGFQGFPVIHELAASRVSSCRRRGALALRPSRAREVWSGVDRIAAPPPPVARAHNHLEVQMRLAPMSVASRADGANHLAADETGVLRKPVTIRIQVGVVVDEMLALVGCIYREPTLAVPLQSEHTPIVGGQDRCTAWCGDVDGAVDTGSAARGSKVVGYLIWRHARDGHHELPRAERTVEGRLASWEERAPRDLKCNERQRAPSAPSPVHLTAAFAIASVRAPRRFGYHSHLRFRRRRGVRGRHINLRRFAQPLLELPHRLPEISHHLGQATRAEHQQDDDEDDDQLAYAHAEHGRRS